MERLELSDLPFKEERQHILTEGEVEELVDMMAIGATAFLTVEGGRYADGASLIIATRFKEGLGLAVHFASRERMLAIRDSINARYPDA